MKINNAPKGKSFGIPEELKEQAERAKAAKDRPSYQIEKEEGPVAEEEKDDSGWDIPEAPEKAKKEEAPLSDDEKAEALIKGKTPLSGAAFQKEIRSISPKSLLKAIGVDFQEEDLTSIVFKGYVEKEAPIIKLPGKSKPLTVTLHLLQTEELDLVDELCAEDLASTKMTNMGVENRRSIWTMAFAVVAVAGKPLAKPVKDEGGEIDKKATALERRKVLLSMAPGMIDEMVRRHTVMQMAYNSILFGDEGEELKK